jgi:hypothetical protein
MNTLVGKSILGFLLVAGLPGVGSAQGTIQFFNSALSRISYQAYFGEPIISGTAVPGGFRIGVFWVPDSAGSSALAGIGKGTLVTPTTLSQPGGLFNAGAVYPIPGTLEGQRVWLKIAGWAGSADTLVGLVSYGESQPVNVVLGPTAGPGTVVWQSSVGMATDRTKPFLIGPGEFIPEPSILALSALMIGLVILSRPSRRK